VKVVKRAPREAVMGESAAWANHIWWGKSYLVDCSYIFVK
jgi:hypothetical protein